VKLQKFRAAFGRVVVGIGYISLVMLFIMVIVVAVDVVLRKISGGSMRIDGSNEITGFFMVVVCTLWIPALQLKNGHILVTLFTDKFPYRFRCFWLCVIMLLESAVIALLTIGAYRKVIDLFTVVKRVEGAPWWMSGRLTDVLNMPMWLFAVFVLIAFLEYFIISLIDTIQLCIDGIKNEPPAPADKGWSEDEVKGI